MANYRTGATAKKYYNPFCMIVTPFTNENTVGTDSYRFDDVVRDTTSIIQDDNEVNAVDNEFSNNPIVENVTLGDYVFNSEVADFQPAILTKFAGFTEASDGKILAPSVYKPLFAKVELVFLAADGTYMAAVLPKIQLNTKATLESINTNVGRAVITGTGYNFAVGDVETPFYLDPNFTLPSTFTDIPESE